jgi:hypothetical protein
MPKQRKIDISQLQAFTHDWGNILYTGYLSFDSHEQRRINIKEKTADERKKDNISKTLS